MRYLIEGKRHERGFTLVELAVVIVVIGVLAAFGVPKFKAAVEKAKAGEAFNYLAALRASQERYHSQYGTYADKTTKLDAQVGAPEYFSVGADGESIDKGGTSSIEDSWSLTLSRKGASAGYGAYTITYSQDGYDKDNSNIDPTINPRGE